MKQIILTLLLTFIFSTKNATSQNFCDKKGNVIPENQAEVGSEMKNIDVNQILFKIRVRYKLPIQKAPVLFMVNMNTIQDFTCISAGYTYKEAQRYNKISLSLTPYGGISMTNDSFLVGQDYNGDVLLETQRTSPHMGILFLFKNNKWYYHLEVKYIHMNESGDVFFQGEVWKSFGERFSIGAMLRTNTFAQNIWSEAPNKTYSKLNGSLMIQHNFNCYLALRGYFNLNYNSFEKKRIGGIGLGLEINITEKR